MNGRQRVKNALDFKKVDKVPLEYYYTPVGYYEHGEKLNDLFASLPGDFQAFERKPIPIITKEQTDKDGNYHEFKQDPWQTVWEYRIYGIAGIPKKYPLEDLSQVYNYKAPDIPLIGTADFFETKKAFDKHKENYYLTKSAGSLLERMIALSPDENIYCELIEGSKEINVLADLITENISKRVEYLLALDVDGISFGDDYGSESTLLLSPELWRSFFKPRWKYLFDPILKAGKYIHFHSCGYVLPILEDLRELGISSIWPQLPAYNMEAFAKYCKSIGLAVVIHTDRANTMTFGSPQDVKDLVKREYEVFDMHQGGSWFYVEADNGFPFENLEALVEAISKYR